MFEWLRKRTGEESQIERLVDDIESPADPSLAEGDQEHIDNVKNSARAAVVAAIVVVAVIAAAIFVMISLRGGWPA